MDEKPKCPYRCNSCVGSSDEAFEWCDQDAWFHFSWMCDRCRIDYQVANRIRYDDDVPAPIHARDRHSCTACVS